MARQQTMEDELIKCPDLKLEDVTALRDWARMQPHLPNIDEIPDIYLVLFLRRRYYSLERAKQILDEFLTFQTLVPELCSNRRSDGPETRNYFEIHYSGPLEKRDLDGNAVFFVSFRHNDATNYNFDYAMKTWLTAADAWVMENGSANGLNIAIDLKNFTMAHIGRISMSTVKKMNYYNRNCAPMSVKAIYALNSTPFTQKVLSFFQPLLDNDIFSKIKAITPSQMEDFYKIIPREQVPKDFGGYGPTMEDITRKGEDLLRRHDDFYAKLESLKVDERKRSGPKTNINTLFGLEGTFKKLNVD